MISKQRELGDPHTWKHEVYCLEARDWSAGRHTGEMTLRNTGRHGGTHRPVELELGWRQNPWPASVLIHSELQAGASCTFCLHCVSKEHLCLKQEAVTLHEHCLPWVFGGKEPSGRTWSFLLR